MTEIGSVLADAIHAIEALWQDFYDAGKYIFEGLWEGMKSMVPSIIGTSATTVADSLSTINSTAEVNSPSKATTRTGRYMGEGLIVGWESTTDDFVASVSTTVNDVINTGNNLTASNSIVSGSLDTSSEVSSSENGSFKIYQTIQLGDTKLKDIVSTYTLQKIGNDYQAILVAQGAYT